jgi:hypothetical protein
MPSSSEAGEPSRRRACRTPELRPQRHDPAWRP